MTRFRSSPSGLGRVKRLTATVTRTQTTSDHQPLYMLTAIGLAFGERATYRVWSGLNAAGANVSDTRVARRVTPGSSTTGTPSTPNLSVSPEPESVTAGARTWTGTSARAPCIMAGSVTAWP